MILFPNAKINLGLNILRKRSDGYHEIETVFYPAPIYDALEAMPAANEQGSFNISGLDVPGDKNSNLIYKAYLLLKDDHHLPAVDIHLLKNIPMGAGLGGGSADAAFMLKLLNELFELKLSENKLQQYAARLGADCAFFIHNKPVFAKGKGDEFEDIQLDLSGYSLQIFKPDIHINTALAYSEVKPAVPDISIKEIIKEDPAKWKTLLTNDFEEAVFRKYPEIAEIKNKLYESGAIYASMSGSGSAVYGLFNLPASGRTWKSCNNLTTLEGPPDASRFHLNLPAEELL